MKLSIAMCTYNGARYLTEQLESIAAQTRRPDEVVICDDCSRDNTREILEDFAATAQIPIRLHFNERNLGSSKNFEQAIKRCSGEVIALCDQDDIWHADKLAKTEAVLAAAPEAGLVFTNGEVVDESLQPVGHSLWEGVGFGPTMRAKVRAGRAFNALLVRTAVTGATMLFRSRFVELVLPIPDDVTFIHDAWIALLIAATAEVAMIDEPLIKYRLHAEQQIGATIPVQPSRKTLRELQIATGRRNLFWPAIHQLRTIRDRLAAKCTSFESQNAQQLVQAMLAHLEARATMSERNLTLIPCVLRELFTLSYHRYSRGLGSAIKDLLSR